MAQYFRSNLTKQWLGPLASLTLIAASLGCSLLPEPKPPKACITAKTYEGSNPPESGSPAAKILGCWTPDNDDSSYITKFEDGYAYLIKDGMGTEGKQKYSFPDSTTIEFASSQAGNTSSYRCKIAIEENHFTIECSKEIGGGTTVRGFRRLFSASSYEPPANTNQKESK